MAYLRSAAAALSAAWLAAAPAGANQEPDLTLRPGAARAVGDADQIPAGDATSPPVPGPAADVPWGFYRDRQGRTMQVSFDLDRRVWLGVGYAPRRTPTGQAEIAPAAFDFGASTDELSADGLTRHRFRIMNGEVRLHTFGLDITGFRYDLSHHYDKPLVRVTTFFGAPERHDLYLNVGLYTEALRLQVAPRGIDGEQSLTLGNVQATLDLWQSADLRSYVRLRAGPGVEMRIGPWGDEARYVGFLPQAIFEGNLLLGRRALQQVSFRVRGDFLRSVSWNPRQLPGQWLAAGEAAYEAVLIAINDQPVSLRLAAQLDVRDDARAPPAPATLAAADGSPGWELKGTAGIRMSFFSPPVAPAARR